MALGTKMNQTLMYPSQVFDKDRQRKLYIDPLKSVQTSALVDHINKLRYTVSIPYPLPQFNLLDVTIGYFMYFIF